MEFSDGGDQEAGDWAFGGKPFGGIAKAGVYELSLIHILCNFIAVQINGIKFFSAPNRFQTG